MNGQRVQANVRIQPEFSTLRGRAADLLAPVAQAVDGATALRDLGMIEADLDRTTVIATRNPYWNPLPVDPVPLRASLQRAWAGELPVA